MNNMCCYHKTIFLSFPIQERNEKKRERKAPDNLIQCFVLNEARLVASEKGICMVIILGMKAFF